MEAGKTVNTYRDKGIMIDQRGTHAFLIKHRSIGCNAELNPKVMMIYPGDCRQFFPEKRLSAKPAHQNLLPCLLLELRKSLSKLKNDIRAHDVTLARNLTAVTTKITAQIARLVHAPNDDKLFLSHG